VEPQARNAEVLLSAEKRQHENERQRAAKQLKETGTELQRLKGQTRSVRSLLGLILARVGERLKGGNSEGGRGVPAVRAGGPGEPNGERREGRWSKSSL
jgi:hypothetical protein